MSFTLSLCVLLFVRGGAAATAVNRPPTIKCPPNQEVAITGGKSTTTITWKEPYCFDPEDSGVDCILDQYSKASGSQFPRGIHFIKYRTYDSKKSVAECIFSITVEASKCAALAITHGYSNCEYGAITGQVCKVTCHDGYDTPGASQATCQSDGSYDAQPQCTGMNFYRQICNSIVSSTAINFIHDIDQGFADLLEYLRTGYVSSYRTFEYLRTELCINENAESKGPCIFLRRYDLFQNLKVDLRKIPVNPPVHNDKSSNIYQYTYRRLLLTHPMISPFCKRKAFLDELLTYLPDFLRFPQSSYMYTFRSVISGMVDSVTTVLRQEATKACSNEYNDPNCLLRDLFGVIDRSRVFLGILDNPGERTQQDLTWYKYGITFSSVIMKWKYGTLVQAIQPLNVSDHMNCVTEIIRAISKYVDDGEDDKIHDLMSLFPTFETDKICNTGTMCLFWRVVDQTDVYVNARKKKGSSIVDVRIINTQLDKKEFLKQKQMERILQLLVDQSYNLVTVAEELKKEFKETVNKRFSELKDYFKKVHKFSAAVAAADMLVLHQLDNLTASSRKIARDLDFDLGKIVSMTMTAVIGEVVEKTVKLAMATAESANPFHPTPSKVIDVMSQLANALAKLEKAVRLAIALSTTIQFNRDLKEKFSKNKEFLTVMNTIKDTILNETTNSPNFRENKDKFLKAYADYTPAVTKPEISQLATYLTNVITIGCDLIKGLEGITAATVKVLEAGDGTCSRSKVKASKMVTTLEEIYDKQYDLRKVILTNVKAQVGLEAAEGMLQGYDELAQSQQVDQDVLQNLKQTAGMSYIVYRIMVIQVIRMYCDELEYKNAGIRPDVCKDARTDISTLLAYKEKPCQTTRYHYEPITTYKKWSSDKSYFNVPVLYSGSPSMFKIPHTRWLVKYRWINTADINSVLYVQGFEIYLPSDVNKPRLVRVEVEAVGENELVPGENRYKLLPGSPMVYEYRVGHNSRCRQSSIENPYTLCETNKLNRICPYSGQTCEQEEYRNIHPSLFSTFKIRVSGYEDVLPPDSSTPLQIQVAVKTCIMPRPDLDITYSLSTPPYGAKENRMNTCCGIGMYWDVFSMNCQSCPVNSTTALVGYYCEKDKVKEEVKPAKIYPTPTPNP